jgi:glycosyltransferase involved in cell wall biosynthesis
MIPKITFHPSSEEGNPVFSILIPSWNNLPYLKCCVESIRKNSRYKHQIIVHVNEGKDQTLEWVKSEKLSHTHSSENTGVCYGFNASGSLAKSDYILLSDDDMYYAPDWDFYIYEEIKNLDHIYFCITGTMIEHTDKKNPCVIAPHDYGKTVQSFNELKFLNEFKTLPFHTWTGGNWYPLVIHKNIWNLIGGLSVEFTPGMGSDPDMMMKLWKCGIRYYKGINESRVYHFGSLTTSRIKKNPGSRQFLIKWGMAQSTFFKYFLRMGQVFSGYTPEPNPTEFQLKRRTDKLKRLISVWKK